MFRVTIRVIKIIMFKVSIIGALWDWDLGVAFYGSGLSY